MRTFSLFRVWLDGVGGVVRGRGGGVLIALDGGDRAPGDLHGRSLPVVSWIVGHGRAALLQRGRSDRAVKRGCDRCCGQRVSSAFVARRSSIALYPSAACSSGRVRSKTLPGSIVRSQISWISSGRNRRSGAGPPCRCPPDMNSSSPEMATSWDTPTKPTWPPGRVE